MLDKAPEFPEGFRWLNVGEPLSMARLRGYIVVLDFWTYCCINCMHMIAELTRLEHKYRDKPVVFIGVHSAKFYNEQYAENIEQAIMRYEIEHPVVVDEGMRIWRMYGANAWPTIVIVDPLGNIVYRRSGEGQGELMDEVIELLLYRYSDGRLADKPLHTGTVRYSRPRSMLSFPGKLAFSPDGSMIAVSDSNNNRILVLALDGNGRHRARMVESIGNGKGLRDGKFDEAMFFRPQGVAWADHSSIYVADTENHSIRLVDLSRREVSTVAGNGRQGYYTHGGYGKGVSLNSPWDVAYSRERNALFIAMAGLHQIWLYSIDDSTARPFAGSGYEGIVDSTLEHAQFAQPSGLYLQGEHLYVADSESSSVRLVDMARGRVHTLVGKDLFIFGHEDGRLDEALLQHPLGVSAMGERVYVADTYNHAIRLLELRRGEVSTLVGRAGSMECRLDESCTLMLYEPSDVKVKGDLLYITDTNNHLLRVFDTKERVLYSLEIVE
ncbi:MAG: thioredoxin-like domain-containing protein [Candidatus Nitrosocaldus sp.]|nr:thioredoxin-like domain-containing protein [Candidatus Nitrosocaldus sp.]MDW8000306.1 thioredoxin-like domain-containing protein [Candidatus Nitrosocaldus sp.]